jgi:hypothetical protein
MKREPISETGATERELAAPSLSGWDEWLMDVTLWPYYCFSPRDRQGNIVIGMVAIQDRSPGKLAGVIHADGQEAVEAWIAEHPEWPERYKPNAGTEARRPTPLPPVS